MPVKTQIYALKTVPEAVATAEAGVDFIGVTVGERGRLPWELDFRQSRELFAAVRGVSEARVLALTVAWDEEEIVETVVQTSPDLVHLSGDFDRYTPELVVRLRSRLSPVKVMMAIPVGAPDSVAKATRYARAADVLILDTDRSHVPGVGATGEVHDWNLSAEIVRRVNIPVVLAGGLGPDNVQEAIRRVRPWAVDSYTHTNAANTRYKDLEKVAAFNRAAKALA